MYFVCISVVSVYRWKPTIHMYRVVDTSPIHAYLRYVSIHMNTHRKSLYRGYAVIYTLIRANTDVFLIHLDTITNTLQYINDRKLPRIR